MKKSWGNRIAQTILKEEGTLSNKNKQTITMSGTGLFKGKKV